MTRRRPVLISTGTDMPGVGLTMSSVTRTAGQEVTEQFCAKLDIDAAAGMRKTIGAQCGKHSLEQHDCQQAGRRHIQSAEAAVYRISAPSTASLLP